jgi:hypothetical protein
MKDRSRKPHVILAACVVIGLAALLTVRLVAQGSTSTAPRAGARVRAPSASVPSPSPIVLTDLTVPWWGSGRSETWPVRFRTDLDLLAPLGEGPGNVAEWYKDFVKPDGARVHEAEAAMARRVDHGDVGRILPPNDPLLLEAAPWMDQASMRFYPGIFPVEGYRTRIPNLLLALTFARSWYAEGLDASDPKAAAADFRRVIRLGRLLRQDDVIIVSDLVGLACIRIGTEGLYDLAIKEGDVKLALAAAVVLGEHAPQRFLTKQRLARFALERAGQLDRDGHLALRLPGDRLDAIVAEARSAPDRRFRCEAVATLQMVRAFGNTDQREKARAVLAELSTTEDPLVAASARWDGLVTPDDLKGFLGQYGR